MNADKELGDEGERVSFPASRSRLDNGNEEATVMRSN